MRPSTLLPCRPFLHPALLPIWSTLGLAVAIGLGGCASPIRLYPDPTAAGGPMRAQPPGSSSASSSSVPPSMPRSEDVQALPSAQSAEPEAVAPPVVTMLPPADTVASTTSRAPLPPSSDDARLNLLRGWIAGQQRLYRVAAPLLMNNTQLCPQFSRRILGFTAKNQYSYSSDLVLVAHDGLGLGDQLQIANVLPRSGAEMAGLQRGDLLVSSAGQVLPTGPDAERAAASQLADASAGSTAVELTVQRGEERISTTVRLTSVCAMVIDLGNTDDAASLADGRRVMITRGMLDFTRSDTELAYALAWQIAANIAGPGPKPAVANLIDRLHTLSTASTSTSDVDTADLTPVSAEVAAATDRLALYLLARAGVPLAGVHAFQARLAETPAAGGAPVITPVSPAERLSRLDREIGVIEMKRKKGVPLVP